MSNKSVFNNITDQIVKFAKNRLGDRLDKVILYGSYARGDYTDESDIDIMVIADINNEEIQNIGKELWDIGWELGYDNNVIICVYITDCTTYYKFINDLPFYKNINKDGILLSA